MPIVSSSAGVCLLTSLAPLVAAATVTINPNSESYTLYGTTFAVVLTLLYLRSKNPRITPMHLGFSLMATAAIGWIMPDIILYFAQKKGWVDLETIAEFPNKVWALAGLLAGLAGTTLIRRILVWIDSRGEPLLERVMEVHLPSIKSDSPSEAIIIKQEIKKESGTKK